MSQQHNKVTKIHRPFNVSIGIIICIIVFIYVAFRLFSYLTDKDIPLYEVSAGTIEKDYEFKALALRDEVVQYSPRDGYIYYFSSDIQRVGAKSLVCMIDEKGNVHKEFSNYSLSDEALDTIALRNASDDLRFFNNNYSGKEFSKVYGLRSSINTALYRVKQDEVLSVYADEINKASNQDKLSIIYAPIPGIATFEVDGYEDINIDNFTEAMVDEPFLSDAISSENIVQTGDAIYKIITSDNWKLVIKANEDLLNDLSDKSYIEIEFTDDNTKTWVSFDVISKNGVDYIVLNLDDGMERYADSRYCNIRLLIHESKGLKIPVSAITTKTFFCIPKVYFTKGGNSNDFGLIIKGSDNNTFVSPTIYYESEDCFYIDDENVQASDYIISPNLNQQYQVGSQTAELVGVYNINKGFAVFKQIEIIATNKDFAIIKTGTSYGLALYDHIALYGDKLKEYDMI